MRQDLLRRTNRNARHPVNAMLNYAYAVLESQVRTTIAEAGLDPTIGYLHACQPGRQALVYDLMEPYRPHVDREVLTFVRLHAFTPRDFLIDSKGVCRLHPSMTANLVRFGALQTPR
jgi:CRISPR-associated protein Cas1